MKNIKGEKLDKLPFELHKIEDIIYYDGPILSHFKSDNNEDYIYYWADVDNICNRWMVFPTDVLNNKENKTINLYDMIRNNDFVYLVDINGEAKIINVMKVDMKNIPDDYLPDIDAHF